MQDSIRQLDRIRRSTRLLLVAQRLASLVTWMIAAVAILIVIDYLFRFPPVVRAVMLAGGVAVLISSLWRYLGPAVRFRPTLTQIALRVERLVPPLSQRLASSVEFAGSGMDKTNRLAAHSVEETQSLLATRPIRSAINWKPTAGAIAVLIAVVAAAFAAAFTSPTLASIGIKRLLLPFTSEQWPSRTGVASAMHDVIGSDHVYATGRSLPLRARVTKGRLDQPILAHYRLFAGDEPGSWRTLTLTHQRSDIHERLLDPSATADAEFIEVYFSSDDDQTPPQRITLVPPPVIVRAEANIAPPEYAAPWIEAHQFDLGTGQDDRAATPSPILRGSSIQLNLTLNKPLPVPDDEGERAVWLADVLDFANEDTEATMPVFTPRLTSPGAGGQSTAGRFADLWTLEWTADRTRIVDLAMTDEYGLTNREPISFRFDVVADRPPSVTITSPDSDDSVLKTAVIELAGEARDDVAVSTLSLRALLQPHPQTEPRSEAMWTAEDTVNTQHGTIRRTLDLSAFDLAEGDTVLINAIAEDTFYLDGQSHEPAESATRRLRIISELELATRLRRDLAAIRQQAIRLEDRQRDVQDDLVEQSVQPGLSRAQAQLGQRIAEQRDSIRRLSDQMQDNRLDDPQIEELLQQAGDLLEFAGRASTRAVEAIDSREHDLSDRDPDDRDTGPDRAPDRDPDTDDLDRDDDFQPRRPAPEDQDIFDAQQDVRQELTDLIELLDRDEDTWLISRQLQSLLEAQQELEHESSQLADQTLGRSLDQLNQTELNELDRIAMQQRELADQVRQLIEEMRRRADSVRDVDERAADALAEAARTGEMQQVDQQMEQAADRVDQNQMRQARQSQQQARQTLQEMLEQARQTRRASIDELQRRLMSLVQSIERLVTLQEGELIALAEAREFDDFTGRDRAMIRLNQNTLAVASEARGAGGETRRIARALDRAADAQGDGIAALRRTPVDATRAEEAGERALEQLRIALELAEELQQQIEHEQVEQRREELLNRYRELLERQIGLRGETRDLHEQSEQGRLDRRQLVESRRLGVRQDRLRVELDDLHTSTEELQASTVFTHAHRRIDSVALRTVELLGEGQVGAETSRLQHRIAQYIAMMIETLEDAFTPPDEFESDDPEGEGDGEGDSGTPPLIPDIAELRLLRAMQVELLEQTQRVDEESAAGTLDDDLRRRRLRELGDDQSELMELGRQLLEELQGDQPPADMQRREPPELDNVSNQEGMR